MSNALTEHPAPMTREEYMRRYADACVKADVVAGPKAPCNEATEARLASQATTESAGGGDAVRVSPISGLA